MKKPVAKPVKPELPLAREVGARAKLIAHKKTELRIGWEGASQPEVLDILTAYDAREIEKTAAVLMARYS